MFMLYKHVYAGQWNIFALYFWLSSYGVELPVAAVSFAVRRPECKKLAARRQWHNKKCLCMRLICVRVCL